VASFATGPDRGCEHGLIVPPVPPPFGELAFLALSALVAVLFLLTVAFSGYAFALRIAHERRERLWGRLSEEWTDPVLGALTDPDSVPSVRATVPVRYQLHFVGFVLSYSQRVRGEELRTLRNLVRPYLDEIARRARHRRAGVRMRAVQTLGALGLPRYTSTVLAALDDPERAVAVVAARSLARPEYAEHGPALLSRYPRFEGMEPLFLASLLADVGPTITPELRLRLADPATPAWLRAIHAVALRIQGDPLAADLAASLLTGDVDLELRIALLKLLAKVGRPDHVSAVLPLVDARSSVVRAHALRTLGVLGDEALIPLLERALTDESPWAALDAARGLLAVGGVDLLRAQGARAEEHPGLVGQVLEAAGS
jgi:HEAT repeat protein